MKKTFFFAVIILFWMGSLQTKAQSTYCSSSSRTCEFQFNADNNLDHQDFVFQIIVQVTGGLNDEVFETSGLYVPGNTTAIADTVMSLVNIVTGEVLCWNDDRAYGVYSSKIVIGPSSASNCSVNAGQYLLVIRSYGPNSGGIGNLLKNGTLIASQFRFGGRFWYTGYDAGDAFQAANVSLKGDPAIPALGLGYGAYSFDQKFSNYGGVANTPKVTTGTDTADPFAGFLVLGRLVTFPQTFTQGTRKVKVYRNDTDGIYEKTAICNNIKDKDCDGLGDKLEIALGTCPCTVNPRNPLCTTAIVFSSQCYQTHHAADSDGDGIPDSWEVFGRESPTLGSMELSRFGADPRHKDIFVEIDQHFTTQNGNPLAAFNFEQVFTVFHEGSGDSDNLRNPDGLQGIRIHMDVVGHVKTNWSIDPNYSYGDMGGSSAYDSSLGASGATMNLNRVGIWRLGARGQGLGGMAGNVIGFYLEGVFIHEMGHMLGLEHWGNPTASVQANNLPNYPSRMNYMSSPARQDDRFFRGGLKSINPYFINEKNGLIPTNICPTFNSPYCDYSYLDINVTQTLRNSLFAMIVDNNSASSTYGSIDWNRDGIYNSGTIRAYLGYASGVVVDGGTIRGENINLHKSEYSNRNDNNGFYLQQYTKENFQNNILSTTKKFVGGVAMAHYQSTVHLLAQLRTEKETDYINPQTPDTIEVSEDFVLKKRIINASTYAVSWVDIAIPFTPKPSFDPVYSPTMTTTEAGASEKLHIVYVDYASGELFHFYLSSNGNSPPTSLGEISAESPHFQKDSNGIVSLYFLQSGKIYSKLLQGTTWSDKYLHQEISPNGSIALEAEKAPAVFEVMSASKTYMILPRSTQTFVYEKSSTNTQTKTILWTKVEELKFQPVNDPTTSANLSSWSHFSAIYDAANSETNRLGFTEGLHAWFLSKSTINGISANRVVRLSSLPHQSLGNPRFRIHLSPTITPYEVSINSRGAPALLLLPNGELVAAFNDDGALSFVPYADGIFNEEIPSTNDWAVMADYMCHGIARQKVDINGIDTLAGAGSEICVKLHPSWE